MESNKWWVNLVEQVFTILNGCSYSWMVMDKKLSVSDDIKYRIGRVYGIAWKLCKLSTSECI